MADRDGAKKAGGLARIVAIVGAAFFGIGGIWAMAAPRSFFESTATFEPYNQHFIQDIGAFMLGLAAVLILALAARGDALTVALLGVGIGSIAHTISHIIGIDLGGSPARDIPFNAVLSVALIGAGIARMRT